MENSLKNMFYKLPRIFRSRVFLIVLFIKIMMSFMFGSDVLVKGTIPFVNYFVESGFANPYNYFFSIGYLKAFPYPPVMLYIFALFRGLAPFISELITPLTLFIYRIPILLADILIYYLLAQLLKPREVLITVLYWCSPILIYINYFHGQLDVIPIALLFLFIYLIYKNKLLLASLILGLSAASKTHLLLVFPVFFIFLWKQRLGVKKIILYPLLSGITFLICLIPFIFSNGFYHLVFKAQEQFWIFNLFITLGDLQIYLLPAILLILFLGISTFNNMNKDLFLMVITLIYTLLIIFISPMPGWYYWSLPFIVFFLVKEAKLGHIITYGLLNVFYLLHFIFIKESDIFQTFQVINPRIASFSTPYMVLQNMGVSADLISNLLITALTTTLVLILYWIYKIGIENNLKYNLVNNPLVIGICGDSSSGKTTLTRLLTSMTNKINTTVVSGDDVHKWERGDKKWTELTHLDPKANNLYLNFYHAKELLFGKKVHRKKYDHDTGKFTKPKQHFSKRFIVFEGLHQFIVPRMREFYDMKIFLDIDEKLRKKWKLERDTKKRAYSKEKVKNQLEMRENDSRKYILPQKKFADIIIKYNAKPKGFSVSVILKEYIDVELLAELLKKHNIRFEYEFVPETFELICKFDGDITIKEVREIAFKVLPNLREILDNFEPEWCSGKNGILQIILLMNINEAIKNKK